VARLEGLRGIDEHLFGRKPPLVQQCAASEDEGSLHVAAAQAIHRALKQVLTASHGRKACRFWRLRGATLDGQLQANLRKMIVVLLQNACVFGQFSSFLNSIPIDFAQVHVWHGLCALRARAVMAPL